jgi:membrane protein required for colicin V production
MIIDAICLIIGLYGFWVGYSRGIIETVLTAASYLLGAMAAAKFSPTVSDMLTGFFHAPASVMLPAGFLLTFILTLILFRMLANGLEGMLEAVNINFINQVMGGFISMLFFLFIFSALVAFANGAKMIDEDTKAQSLTYRMLEPMPDAVWKLTKNVWPVFTEFYYHTLETFDQINTSVERQEDDTFFDIEEDEEENPSEEEEYESDERASDRPWRY